MPRRKIREYDAKRIIAENISRYGKTKLDFTALLVTPETALETLPKEHPWLEQNKLVVKPDQLFGKRKKHHLVLVDVNYGKAKEFIESYRNKEITIGQATGVLTHFLIEPFVPHTGEYYLSLVSEREGDMVFFSADGGVDIEENWDKVTKIFIPTLASFPKRELDEKIPSSLPKEKLLAFVEDLYQLYRDLGFTYLELNPFCFGSAGNICLLDAVARLDDDASFWKKEIWGPLEFPPSFGQRSCPEEGFIDQLNENSGASLKLTVLNPQGRIWNILSGGGASIIYLDTLVESGKGEEIANYGEYSGNPTTEESYHYAKTILHLMTKEPNPKGKILVIGGAIANFTDVEKTFQGIIAALKEYQEQLRTGNIQLFVRRGGPNYEKGLKLMEQAGKELGIPLTIAGPETPMVQIVGQALEALR